MQKIYRYRRIININENFSLTYDVNDHAYSKLKSVVLVVR